MDAKTLMDSRRFCLLMDDLAATWSKKRASDEDKEFRLQAVLDALGAAKLIRPIDPGSTVSRMPEPPSPPGPPAPTLDELYAQAIENARNTPPGPDGVRWTFMSLDAPVEGLGDYLERTRPGFAVSENHPIGLSGGKGMREGWSIPFIG